MFEEVSQTSYAKDKKEASVSVCNFLGIVSLSTKALDSVYWLEIFKLFGNVYDSDKEDISADLGLEPVSLSA